MEEKPEALGQGIAEQVRRLVDREVGIARAELQEKAAGVAGDAMLLGAAGILGYAALLAYLAAAIDAARGPGRSERPVWRGALLVGTGLLVSGSALGAAGLARLRARDVLPRRTIESVGRAAEAAAES